MNLLNDFSLRQYNTFGVDSRAEYFAELNTLDDAKELVLNKDLISKPRFILGGGSNVLFRDYVQGLVVKVGIKGREILHSDDDSVNVKFCAGEVWHNCVTWAVENGYGGIENLALIPGTIGASPIQNIGAYGAEVQSSIVSVEYLEIESGELKTIHKEGCEFKYRDSIFKNLLKNKVIITAVTLKLSKNPIIHAAYKDLTLELEKNGIEHPTIRDVYDCVVAIRTRKLPDYKKIGNAGSFFKNTIIEKELAERLLSEYPAMPHFEADDKVKIPSAWLIEQCGFKGIRRGDAGVYEHHALVLINHGNAKGNELLALAHEIQEEVKKRFTIQLEIEVNIV